jgi:sarcosine oxidase, subunit alpha
VSGYRLPSRPGEIIDRVRTISFSFNGKPASGFEGDTVASALLAQGVVHIGRSFKLHRPRGVFSCGVEEPTALLDIGTGASLTPNSRATDTLAVSELTTRTGNAWPNLKFDLAALNNSFSAFLPAGFYYKTFMWPNWHLFEPTIRRMAGLGNAATGADPERYDAVSRSAEVLVIGGGAAGMQAAISAASGGRQVLLLEAAGQLGGWLATQAGINPVVASAAGIKSPADTLIELQRAVAESRIEVRTLCTGFGLYDHGLVAASEIVERGGIRERLWQIRAQRIIVATGAFERPMLFPDNDRPGVMLASSVERYAALYGVACGRQVLIAAACDSAYAVAHSLTAVGVNVVAVVDCRTATKAAPPSGVRVYQNSSIVAVKGGTSIRAVSVVDNAGGPVHELDVDCIASAGGWTPAVQLHSMAGGKLRWVDESSMFVPIGDSAGLSMVGACAGAFDFVLALAHAAATGRDDTCAVPVGGLGVIPAKNLPSAAALASINRRCGKIFVDLQNDVTAADVELAARENYRSVEHLKRYTTMGMATDQGKTSNINALVLMGEHTQQRPEEVGTTKFRPPFRPVTLNALAGGRSGARWRPLKHMPGEDWHVTRGATFEEFGGWWRPAAYLRPGENLDSAAQREALHTRTHVGVFEGSPLGKLEIRGPDAAAFLDLMYVGTMSTMAVGQARYGLLLHETGIIFDDGIVARLSDQHFWVNTTSGGAARVALAFEEWLQCEYVHHRVLITPVSSAWGNVTVAGPKAWMLLEAAGFDVTLSPAHAKHMTMREVHFGGIRLRVLRASFSGELSYEINVPALHTHALLSRLSEVGAAFELQPYGIEALMVMRTEKGYLHIGADTDGTSLPGDVGMDRGVAKKAANFVGRRSLQQPAAKDFSRMQLIGLLPIDRRTLLPVGAHIVEHNPPAQIDGFVTSSCQSPILGHPVALAMLTAGLTRIGQQVTAHHLGRSIRAEIVSPVFFDPSGARLNGHL